jgi:hypothetical protein
VSNNPDMPEMGSGPADPQKVKDFWLDVVRPVADSGRLDTIKPAFKGTSIRGRSIARAQNYWITRKSFGMPDGYDRIQWGKVEPTLTLADIDQWVEDFFPDGGDAA